jgi:undecaprenyl-diphosphatase
MTTSSATPLRNSFRKLITLVKRASAAEKFGLLLFGLSVGALFAFGSLADEVIEGDTRTFDEFILLAFRDQANLSDPLGPPWLEEMMRDFTALGGIAVLTAITLTVVGFLVLVHKRHAAMLVGGSVLSGVLLSSLLKWAFDRARPDLVEQFSIVYTQSFPSGHAMLSAVVYLTLGVLLARTQSDPRVKIYLLSVAAVTTVLVGISRVYLGVHWPTDVLAGWTIGAAWALLCWLAMLWLQGRGKVEQETSLGVPDAPRQSGQ